MSLVPKVSYTTILEKWLLGCLVFAYFAFTEHIIINWWIDHQERKNKVICYICPSCVMIWSNGKMCNSASVKRVKKFQVQNISSHQDFIYPIYHTYVFHLFIYFTMNQNYVVHCANIFSRFSLFYWKIFAKLLKSKLSKSAGLVKDNEKESFCSLIGFMTLRSRNSKAGHSYHLLYCSSVAYQRT